MARVPPSRSRCFHKEAFVKRDLRSLPQMQVEFEADFFLDAAHESEETALDRSEQDNPSETLSRAKADKYHGCAGSHGMGGYYVQKSISIP